jgi:hypothetical protein
MKRECDHEITFQNNLVGLNSFCKLYGINKPELLRTIEWGGFDGIVIMDGHTKRMFVDNSVVLKEAKERGYSPVGWVMYLCRLSKK